jgi:2-succinyl-6-hydroxy-2,4-cyclohexadiene-1-carboxylate synthase
MLINDVDYQVSVGGAGRRPLLLLHGFTGSSSSWNGVAARLEAHFRLIRVDLLGHGRSPAPADPARYRIEAAAADLESILQQVAAVPADVLGYSMGGRLALYLALSRPSLVRSLILESASPGLVTAAEREARRRQDDALARRIEQQGIEAFVQEWEQLPLFAGQKKLPPATRQALRRQRLGNRPPGLANSLRGLGTGSQPSLWQRLPELSMPLLLLAGELDEKFAGINREMAAAVPQAHLIIVPGAGHTIHLEQPQLFTAAIVDFLSKLSHPK